MEAVRRGTWLPALLVGAAAGIAGEVAIGILLYASPGFMRSLTTVLAIESLALALGLHTVPTEPTHLVERMRLRWLLCLGAFTAAAAFGTLWSLFEDLGEGRIGQGLGLALLAGLPLFACGSLLGGMGVVAEADPSGRLPRPGANAAMGAALGFVVTGALLPRAPIPASLLVGCLVLLSAGAMVYGTMIGGISDGQHDEMIEGSETEASDGGALGHQGFVVASEHESPPPP